MNQPRMSIHQTNVRIEVSQFERSDFQHPGHDGKRRRNEQQDHGIDDKELGRPHDATSTLVAASPIENAPRRQRRQQRTGVETDQARG